MHIYIYIYVYEKVVVPRWQAEVAEVDPPPLSASIHLIKYRTAFNQITSSAREWVGERVCTERDGEQVAGGAWKVLLALLYTWAVSIK